MSCGAGSASTTPAYVNNSAPGTFAAFRGWKRNGYSLIWTRPDETFTEAPSEVAAEWRGECMHSPLTLGHRLILEGPRHLLRSTATGSGTGRSRTEGPKHATIAMTGGGRWGP